MRKVTVAAVQMRCTENVEENIARAEALVRKACLLYTSDAADEL